MTKIPISVQDDERQCLNGVIDEYMSYCADQECPSDFHMWMIIAVIACALGRHAYKDRGPVGKLFPNLYVILVGESALVHKSTAINMALNPFQEAIPETMVLTQKVTDSALIHALAEEAEKTGDSAAVIKASELSVLLGKAKLDDSLIKLLTDFWDSPSHRDYRTIARGTEICKNVCLNMLAGTTPDWLKNTIPLESLEGGFLSRMILVNRPPSEIKNPHPEDLMNAERYTMLQSIQHDLKIINSNIYGAYEWSIGAKNAFSNWYINLNKPEKATSFMRGYYGRKGDMIIKVAMISAASKSDTRIIEEEDIYFALTILTDNEQHTENIIQMLGTTDEGKRTLGLLDKISKSRVMVERGDKLVEVIGIPHSKLVSNTRHQMDGRQFALAIDVLVQGNDIVIERIGRAKIYVLASCAAGKGKNETNNDA